mgnify:CR=1 FL=1
MYCTNYSEIKKENNVLYISFMLYKIKINKYIYLFLCKETRIERIKVEQIKDYNNGNERIQ